MNLSSVNVMTSSDIMTLFRIPALTIAILALLLSLQQCSCKREDFNTYVLPTHSHFLKSDYYKQSRMQYTGCANNASICLDRVKNPSGGSTCCWNKFCKDTSWDFLHCGGCGNTCLYGLTCCDGRCVDLKNNRNHCGSCRHQCPYDARCSFGMCDYAGAGYSYDGNRKLKHPRGPKHR